MIRKLGLMALTGTTLITVASQTQAAVLFTTQEDFTGFAGNTPVVTAIGDTDGSTINGLGNTTAPGVTGTAGALTIATTGAYAGTLSPGQQGNAALISAISAQTVAIDYTTALTGGNYFQLLLLLNSANSGFLTLNPTVTTAGGINTATYTLPVVPTGQSYLQLGVVPNTNMSGTITFDNIRTVPEPAMLSAFAIGGFVALRRRRA